MKKYAITSGKGGVGKTTLSMNLGISLAQAGHRTVLFDADLQLANVDVMLGLHPEFTLAHVVAGHKKMSEILCAGPDGLMVIGGGSAIPTLMNAGPKRMKLFADQIDELQTDADCLIFDTGAGIDNRVITFCQMADEVIVITTPDPASVADAYATIKVVNKKMDPKPIHVVVNMASSVEEATYIFNAIAQISHQFLRKEVSFLGYLTTQPEVALGNRKRSPFMVKAPESAAADQVREIVQYLTQPSQIKLVA